MRLVEGEKPINQQTRLLAETEIRLSRQLGKVQDAKTPAQVTHVINSELLVGLHGEAYLRGKEKLLELTERGWILDQAYRRGRNRT